MNTHNIYFCREIRKILCGYPVVSVAMYSICYFDSPSQDPREEEICI